MESGDLLKIWARQTLSKGWRNARLKKKNLNIIWFKEEKYIS